MEANTSLTKMDMCKQHMCCAYGAVNAAHVQSVLMCRTCASFCHTSYMRNMYATCVRDMCCLYTCMLQVCCTSVSCMYACYSVLHTCCLHTCKLLVFLICAACIHAYYYSAAYLAAHIRMYTAYIRHIKCITYTLQQECNTIGVHLTVCR